MALYIPHSIFHLARLLYVRPETFEPYCVCMYALKYVCIYVCMYVCMYVVGSKSFRPDQLFKVTEIKQICYFST